MGVLVAVCTGGRAASLIMRHEVGIGRDALIRVTVSVFGCDRTGNDSRRRLLTACEALERHGVVPHVDGWLSCHNPQEQGCFAQPLDERPWPRTHGDRRPERSARPARGGRAANWAWHACYGTEKTGRFLVRCRVAVYDGSRVWVRGPDAAAPEDLARKHRSTDRPENTG